MQTLLATLPDSEIGGKRIDEDKRIFVQGTSPDSIRRRNIIISKYKKGRIKVEGNALIGRHCQLGNGIYIENSVIDNFTIVKNNVKIVKSSIMDRVYLGNNVEIQNSIIGRHVEIKDGVKIINSVIADDVTIGENSEIVNSRIYPHRVINSGSKLHDTILT
jgi:NDP-sugar pyrophosphorylase family protein